MIMGNTEESTKSRVLTKSLKQLFFLFSGLTPLQKRLFKMGHPVLSSRHLRPAILALVVVVCIVQQSKCLPSDNSTLLAEKAIPFKP